MRSRKIYMVIADVTPVFKSGNSLSYRAPHIISSGRLDKLAIYNNQVDAQAYADSMNAQHPKNEYYVKEQTL